MKVQGLAWGGHNNSWGMGMCGQWVINHHPTAELWENGKKECGEHTVIFVVTFFLSWRHLEVLLTSAPNWQETPGSGTHWKENTLPGTPQINPVPPFPHRIFQVHHDSVGSFLPAGSFLAQKKDVICTVETVAGYPLCLCSFLKAMIKHFWIILWELQSSGLPLPSCGVGVAPGSVRWH